MLHWIAMLSVMRNAAITLKIQSVDRIFVFLSADKHQFVIYKMSKIRI